MRTMLVGVRALLVELDDRTAVDDLYAEIERRRVAGTLPRCEEVVPGARTVLLDGLTDPAALARDLTSWHIPRTEAPATALVEVPTVYDGADLAEVARYWEMTTREVIATHTGSRHRVAFCGFAPGFAYLTGLPPGRTVRRRPAPRSAVPTGAVGLADQYTGIYPRSSPGGWQLIGRTDLSLWDTGRVPAALLTPGTEVRFVEVPA